MALPYDGDPDIFREPETVAASETDEVVEADLVDDGLVDEVPAVLAPGTEYRDALLGSVHGIRAELADRDGELRDVLRRLGDLYERLAEGTARAGGRPHADDRSLRTLLRSVDSLAAVTEASVDRIADISRSVQRLAESVQAVAARVDRLVRRTDESEARVGELAFRTEGLGNEVARLTDRLTHPPGVRPPPLKAVGDDGASAPGPA